MRRFFLARMAYSHAFDAARGDLIALLDDGWDVPYGAADGRLFGSLEVDAGRFPSLQGHAGSSACAR